MSERWNRTPLDVRGVIGAAGLLLVLASGGCGQGPPVSDPGVQALAPRPEERVTSRVLRRGETLGGLLDRAGLDANTVQGVLSAAARQVDLRRLPADVTIRFHRWVQDDSLVAVELVLDPDRNVRLDRTVDAWDDRIVATPVHLDTVYATGSIGPGGSLYLSLVDQQDLGLEKQERIQLVYEMAEIYGYQLDFTHDIRPGDTWRLLCEREVRPDGSSRGRRILSAEVVSQDRSYPAVRYEIPGGRTDYFDLKGTSLRLAFKRYPVDYPRITSNFTTRRYHPVLKVNRPHYGTDFGANRGTPAHVTADGTVSFAGRDGSYGNLVKVRHPGGYETRYAHLNGFARGIRSGVRVVQGQTIGYVGSTGLASAPHLHYEIRRSGSPLNPRTVSLPGAPPVPEEHLSEFFASAADRWDLLRTPQGISTFRGAAGPDLQGR